MKISRVTTYVIESDILNKGIMAANIHIHKVRLKLVLVSHIVAGIISGRSYAYALGAQNNEANNAKDSIGMVGKERKCHSIPVAIRTSKMVKGRFPVPTQFS